MLCADQAKNRADQGLPPEVGSLLFARFGIFGHGDLFEGITVENGDVELSIFGDVASIHTIALGGHSERVASFWIESDQAADASFFIRQFVHGRLDGRFDIEFCVKHF